MKNNLFYLIAAAGIASACSTATAATGSLCTPNTTNVAIIQDLNIHNYSITPDQGDYPGPNGEELDTVWLDLRKDNPKTLHVFCTDAEGKEQAPIPVNNASTCRFTVDHKVLCN